MHQHDDRKWHHNLERHLRLSITVLEFSITFLENNYSTGVTHDNCHMTIKIFLGGTGHCTHINITTLHFLGHFWGKFYKKYYNCKWHLWRHQNDDRKWCHSMEHHLPLSITVLEFSITFLENNYSTGVTHDDCYTTIQIFLWYRPLDLYQQHFIFWGMSGANFIKILQL